MDKKIIIAGGTGFVGRYLTTQFRGLGYQVVIIARRKGDVAWEEAEKMRQALDGATMLINLAGKSVNCRYTEKNKAAIFSSRTETTRLLGEAMLDCPNPPKLWINASTATIYRDAKDRPMTESQGEIGTGFSVEVAKKWEKTFFDFQLSDTRQVALRLSIVLGEDGGVMQPFKNLVRFGLGGVFRAIRYIQSQEQLAGVFNCTAPTPVDNRTFMQTFRRLMGGRIGLPAPAWLLEIGAFFIRTETELLLKSRWVIPERLQNEGFVFKYPNIEQALAGILSPESI
jgi:uncharacterized protein (TIGR01777 family)